MKDVVLLALLVASFATLATAHVAIAVRLLLTSPRRYRGLLALALPPLAPYWAWGQRWRKLSALWIGALLSYAALVVVASF